MYSIHCILRSRLGSTILKVLPEFIISLKNSFLLSYCLCLPLCICLCICLFFKSCLLITLIKCLIGDMSLGLLFEGVNVYFLSLSLSLQWLVTCSKIKHRDRRKLHKPSLHFTSLTILTSPTFITRLSLDNFYNF